MTLHHPSFEYLLGFLDSALERAPLVLRGVIDELYTATCGDSRTVHYGESSWRGLGRADTQAIHRLACGLKDQCEDLERWYAADLRDQFEAFILAKNPANRSAAKLLAGLTPPKKVMRAYQVALVRDIKLECNSLLTELPLLLCMLGITESIKAQDSPVTPDVLVHALRAALCHVTARESAVALAFQVLGPLYVAAMRQEYRWCLQTLSSLGSAPAAAKATESVLNYPVAYAAVS